MEHRFLLTTDKCDQKVCVSFRTPKNVDGMLILPYVKYEHVSAVPVDFVEYLEDVWNVFYTFEFGAIKFEVCCKETIRLHCFFKKRFLSGYIRCDRL